MNLHPLDPNDLRCAICSRVFENTDVIVIVELPTGDAGAAHIHHPGMESQVQDSSQIVTGALLKSVAEVFDGQISSEDAFPLFKSEHARLTAEQHVRLAALVKEAKP